MFLRLVKFILCFSVVLLFIGCQETTVTRENSTAESQYNDGDPSFRFVEGFSNDLGEVASRSLIAVEIHVENISSKTIEFSKVIPTSCGSSKAKLNKYSLAPNEKTTLSVSINTYGEEGHERNISIHLSTINPKELHTHQIKYRTKALWKVIPKKLEIICAPGERKTSQLDLVGRSDKTLSISDVQTTVPGFLIKKKPNTIIGGRSEPLIFSFVAPKKYGTTKHLILIRINDEEKPEVSIPITIKVLSPWSTSSRSLLINSNKSKKIIERTILLRGKEKGKNISLNIEGSQGVTASILNGNNPEFKEGIYEYQIIIKCNPNAFLKPIHKNKLLIHLETSSESKKNIVIEVPILTIR